MADTLKDDMKTIQVSTAELDDLKATALLVAASMNVRKLSMRDLIVKMHTEYKQGLK